MSRVGLISGKVGVSAGVSRGNSWHTCIRITRMVYLYKDYHETVEIVNENDLVQEPRFCRGTAVTTSRPNDMREGRSYLTNQPETVPQRDPKYPTLLS